MKCYAFVFIMFHFERIISSYIPLSSFVTIDKHHLLPIISGDDQHIPLYTGCKPNQLEIDIKDVFCDPTESNIVHIPAILKNIGDTQLKSILNQYKDSKIKFIELWPTLGAFGFYTWVYARAFFNATHWIWLDPSRIILENSVNSPLNSTEFSAPYFPRLFKTFDLEDNFGIFGDMLHFSSLYQKPVFGDCLWTSGNYTNKLDEKQTTTIYNSWLPVEQMNLIHEYATHNICVVLPQPARHNGKPYTLRINITESSEIVWPKNIFWYTVSLPSSIEINQAKTMTDEWYRSLHWPKDFPDSWETDMRRFTNETYLRNKSSVQANNQLLDLIEYLIERYTQMNIHTEKQYFQWRNITQANLIAVIPAGNKTGKCNQPVVFIDHIDTAFEEDTFDSIGKRQTTKGADDNVSGLITLLQSVSILKDTQKQACRDIWLVHITGEEYPASSLGVVYFLQQLMIKKQPIFIGVIVDMIAHRVNRTDPIIQINPSDSTKSMLFAELALNYVYKKIENSLILKGLQPVIRRWGDPYSYLYNTDGVRLVQYGFECILFNEHINYHENFERVGYHDTQDTVDLIDFQYGQTVSQFAIATVAMLAHMDCQSVSSRSDINVSLIAFTVLAILWQ